MSRLLTLLFVLSTFVLTGSTTVSNTYQKNNLAETTVAARFAPILYQALGDNPRSDYITNFDFDGDWRGDNNWNNAANTEFALKSHIYYSVAETSTHFFIHYAVFHPRDYKGGERKGALLSELIRQGAKVGAKYDPTGLADEATLAHENDMEGALIVVQKTGNELANANVVFVETVRHNTFARYQPGDPKPGASIVKLDEQRPLLYIEPKGHGIEAFTGDQKQTFRKDFLKYIFRDRADDPAKEDLVCKDLGEQPCEKSVGYDLVSLAVIWVKAKGKANSTFGESFDYGDVRLSTTLNASNVTEKTFKVGTMGCAFLGSVGGINMARPPWGWFDREEKDLPLGQWFFDPAAAIKRDFNLDSGFSTSYVRLPFWAR